MITQTILDFLSSSIAFYLNQLPALPAAFNEALAQIGSVGITAGSVMAKLGPVVPWDAVWTVLTWFRALMLYWVLMVGVRVLMWAINR